MIKYKLKIGDWSDDGHGKCETFILESDAKTMAKVKNAYHKLKELVPPEIHPENICSDYEVASISPEMVASIKRVYGEDVFKNWEMGDGDEDLYIDPELMAEIVAAGITLAGVTTVVVLEEMETLQFYGTDKDGRHIGHIGYGLFR